MEWYVLKAIETGGVHLHGVRGFFVYTGYADEAISGSDDVDAGANVSVERDTVLAGGVTNEP
jgi:hypothetical protein